jgi:hypothetical protein
MKPAHREILIIVVCLILGFLISRTTLHYFPPSKEKVINCSLAEISPDFTPEMRQRCRELRKDAIK